MTDVFKLLFLNNQQSSPNRGDDKLDIIGRELMLFPSSEVISDAKGKSIVILADPIPYAQVNVLVAITNRWLNDHAFFVERDSQVCKWRDFFFECKIISNISMGIRNISSCCCSITISQTCIKNACLLLATDVSLTVL